MFRKIIRIENAEFKIDHFSNLITIGSCFSASIGKKLFDSRFKVSLNPFGTIFHPCSLAKLVKGTEMEGVIERDNYFFNWMYGGGMFDSSEEELQSRLSALNLSFKKDLEEANVVMVTFGTAWGYILKSTNELVANCHKMPQELFEKRLYSPVEIVDAWNPILKANPDVRWVFTVSPVRHWKDGVRENNVSKGVLHQAIHEMMKFDNVCYFPAYEIMLDELRDYRFYTSDYLHPNKEAVCYIWDRFRETYFTEKTDELVRKIERLHSAQNHSIMFPESEENKKFLVNIAKQEEEIEQLLSEYQA